MPYVELDTERPIWDRFLWVAPLVYARVDASQTFPFPAGFTT